MLRRLKKSSIYTFSLTFLLFLLLAGAVPSRVQAAGKTGFVGSYYYKNGKKLKKKAVKVSGKWYVLDSKGKMVRGKTYKLKGKTYRLRKDGTAYTGTWMFGSKFYAYSSKGVLNKSKSGLLNRYMKESISENKKPFSKVKKLLGKVKHTWKSGSCGGSGYFRYYYYEHGYLVAVAVYGKKSYFSYAEKTPWDPSLME